MEDYKGSEDVHVDSSLCSSGSMSSWSLDMSDDDDHDEVMSSSQGPLYELSDLMAQLPMKRGLSKFYDGKTQSFTSLSSVRSIEDLWKKDRPYRYNTRWKVCNGSKKMFGPKATTISKKKGGSLTLFIFNGKKKKGRGTNSIPCSNDVLDDGS